MISVWIYGVLALQFTRCLQVILLVNMIAIHYFIVILPLTNTQVLISDIHFRKNHVSW